jgi:hypothetical protein
VQVDYFDEVKYEKNRSPFYWLGAIVADAEQIQDLERTTLTANTSSKSKLKKTLRATPLMDTRASGRSRGETHQRRGDYRGGRISACRRRVSPHLASLPCFTIYR